MVSFICDACQETVKKAKVENHYQFKCKSCWTLSCVDCGRSFAGEEYQAHNSCISEAEKYQGALYQEPKKKPGSKQDPQLRWTDLVGRLAAQAAAGSLSVSAAAANVFIKMGECDNVPRKEKKFLNYCKSAFHVRPDSDTAAELWATLQDGWNKDKEVMQQQMAAEAKAKAGSKSCEESDSGSRKATGSEPLDEPSSNGKQSKRPLESSEGGLGENDAKKSKTVSAPHSWHKQAKKLLKKASDKTLKVKALLEALREEHSELGKKELKQFLVSKPSKFSLSGDGKSVSLAT